MWKLSFYILVIAILISSCAQVVPLTGGKRDTIAPKVISSNPENKTLNFNEDKIVLKFDEFVQLKDLANQFIVSPSLKTKPTIQSIGKSVIVSLNKEDLEKNTTYRLFFGNAIVDMHENNPLRNFEFVFSTGPHIDTLKQNGQISDALFKEPETDMIVGLYGSHSFSDSTIYKKEPLYYCKTNSTGQFQFAFLPDTTFKLIAFNDKNKNLIYDAEQEKLAFQSDLIRPGNDSIIKLYSFFEAPRKTFLKKTQAINPGKFLLVFNKSFYPKITALTSISIFTMSLKAKTDSIYVFYWPNKDTIQLKVTDEKSQFADTIKLITTVLSKKTQKFPIISNVNNQLLKHGSKLQLYFPQAIDSGLCEISKLILFEKTDSLKTKLPFKTRFVNPTTLEVEGNYENGKEYVLYVDTNIIKSKNGQTNDSVRIKFKLQPSTSLGQIKLNLLLNKKQNYTVQLISPSNVIVANYHINFALSESNNKSILFKNIAPGSYKLRIIFDDDENKEWSTGNYLKQIQPERVEIFSKELKVISDWEIEEEIVIKK